MTDVSPLPIPSPANNISSQADRAGSPSVAGSNPPSVQPPAPRSYASATASYSPTVNLPSKQSSSGASGDQHARSNSVNRPPVMPTPPDVQSAVPNGNLVPGESHSRKPSVLISAAGASGSTVNGGPPSAGPRAGISFGQFNNAGDANGGSVNNAPYSGGPSLSASQHNPRISTPSKSPSPIPQPAASGGRPPGLPVQNGVPNFGNMNGLDNGPLPPGTPSGPGMQPAHLRRHSSQQSEVSNAGTPFTPGGHPNRAYMGSANRQRSFGGPQGAYPPSMAYSPAPQFRQMSQQQHRPGQFPPNFQNQPNMHHMNSPHPPRSPGFHTPQQPGTPNMPHQQMYNYGQHQGPPYGAYQQHHGHGDPYGQQPGYGQPYGYYGGQQAYGMPPQYLQHGPPASPRPFQAPPSSQQQYRQGQFNQASQQMSRTPSHASTVERPGSSMGGPPVPPSASQTPASNYRTHTPSQSTTEQPQKNQFSIPKRESKAIQIKDASGNIINMKKDPSPASVSTTVKSPPPPTGSAGPTPSPAATPAPNHNRSESKSGKSAEEIRAQFQASVKAQSADAIKEEPTPAKEEAQVAATGTTTEADDKLAKEKAEAEAKVAEEKREREEAEAQAEKERADALAQKEKEEQSAREAEAAKAREAEAAAEAKKREDDKAEQEKAAAAKTADEESPAGEAAQGVSDEDAELERQIAEMEAAEKEEEERERAFAEKKRKEKEEAAAREKKSAADQDAEMKRLEREAEELEERRERERNQPKQAEGADEGDVEKDDEFASLAKPTVGPGADVADPTTTATEDSSTPPTRTASAASKVKPTPLKLDTAKPVEPPQPTPAMKSLKSARMLQLQGQTVAYPDGIQSPNPALNKDGKRGGKVYDASFLMQFKDVFQEKPSVDWDQKLKETIGDNNEPQSARSARTPMTAGGKAPPRGPPPSAYQGMGNFGQQGRTLPAGTTSADRFAASQSSGGGRTMNNPLAGFAGQAGGFRMGQGMMPPPGRQPSMGGMSHASSSQRGGTSRRQDSKRGPSAKELEKQAKAMPLTAGADLKPIEVTKGGWKPTSVGQGAAAQGPDLSGHMAPDMVQRKVKAALNKMTPERFDRIAEQILEIAHQSKTETDGRTLRQVIALTFEKACDEAHWASMYARFCFRMLETMSNDIKDETIIGKDGQPVAGGGLFRKYLLNRCQEDFERGWETNLPEKPEGETEEVAMLSDEYYVAAAAKRKGLGLIQFIGELFKLRMLSVKIMHQCFLKLLNFEGQPDETTIESLTKLMRTVGSTMDSGEPGAQSMMNAYFERIQKIMATPNLPSRMHFMLLDVLDLRKAGWREKNDSKGPKTISEIREEAAAAQAAEAAKQAASRQQGRMPSGRGPNDRGFPGGMMQPPQDYRSTTVSGDELRRLTTRRQDSRQASGQRTLGPSTMLSSRSASGRQALGPGGALGRNASGASTSGAAAKKEEPATGGNAFAALAGMGEGDDGKTPVASPKPSSATPAATKEGESSS